MDTTAGVPAVPLNMFQIACLAGGTWRVCETAIVLLADRGLLRAEVRSQYSGRFFAQGTLPVTAHPAERAVHAAAAQPHAPVIAEALHNWSLRTYRTRDQAGKLSERQRRRGQSRAQQGPAIRPVPGASAYNLRLAVRAPARDLQRELQELGLLRTRRSAIRRTSAGRDVLAQLRRRHQSLKEPADADHEPALAVAIWDLGVLGDTRLSGIKQAIRPAVTFDP